MNTWKCLQYVLVCCLSSHTFKWLVGGVFITSPTILAVGQKVDCSIVWRIGEFGAHQTCPVPWPHQPTIGVCSSRPLDPTVAQTTRCTPDSLVLQRREPLVASSLSKLPGASPDSPVHTG
jgi:hypothetical protein